MRRIVLRCAIVVADSHKANAGEPQLRGSALNHNKSERSDVRWVGKVAGEIERFLI
jgi:hypothetical protein